MLLERWFHCETFDAISNFPILLFWCVWTPVMLQISHISSFPSPSPSLPSFCSVFLTEFYSSYFMTTTCTPGKEVIKDKKKGVCRNHFIPFHYRAKIKKRKRENEEDMGSGGFEKSSISSSMMPFACGAHCASPSLRGRGRQGVWRSRCCGVCG